MRTALCAAIAAMSLWAVGVAAQPAAQAAKIGELQVKEVNVAEIDTTHVKLAVDLNLTAAQSVTLEDLRLCSLHLNGLPVFAAPLNQEIVLKKGVATALPPLYVTILFRDLHTVEPLRRMIEKQSVRIEGELTAGVRLTMVEKMALHTQHPSVELALSQEVPAAVGGTALQRGVALTILEVIDSGLQATAMAGKYLPGSQTPWIHALETVAQGNLFAVESSYTLAKDEQRDPVALVQLGFRVTASAVVTTAEAEAPWKYDAEFFGPVQSGAAKVVKNSREMQLRPIGAGETLRLSAGDFSVEARGVAENDPLIAMGGGHSKIQHWRRASPTALAVLALSAPPSSPALTPAPAAVAAQEAWEQVAVFRLRMDAASKRPSAEVLQMKARREGQGIRLSEPVDAAVYGSPIVTPEGVIGLVQDEQTGAFLPEDLQAPTAAAK